MRTVCAWFMLVTVLMLRPSSTQQAWPLDTEARGVSALVHDRGPILLGPGFDNISRSAHHMSPLSTDAIILTLRLQESILLDTTLALEIDAALEAARSTYDTLCAIHAFPDYEPTHLLVSSSAPWTDAWRKGDPWSGCEEVDSLGRVYGLTAVRPISGNLFLLVFAQPMKMPLLAKLYTAVQGVEHAGLDSYGGDGNNIEAFRKQDLWHLAFSLGMGDCPAGCIYRYYWYVTVDKDLTAQLVDERERSLAKPYLYLWNIPPRYAATVFSDVDGLLSIARDATEWWVRRHAVEVIGLLFQNDSPWVSEDMSNRALFEALCLGVRLRRAEVLALLSSLLRDPDEDVRAGVRRALNRVLELSGGDLAFYFPLAVGNWWRFAQGTICRMQDTVRIGPDLYFRLEQLPQVGPAYVHFRQDNKLLAALANSSQVWLDFAAHIGDSWVVSGPVGTRWSVQLQSTTDTVVVPAGIFTNCFRFWFDFGCCDNSWMEWYAPGVGPVKRIHYGVARIEYPLHSAGVCGVAYPTPVEPVPARTSPERFHMYPNHPNPFNSSTWIRYELPAKGFVTLDIYDLSGRRVRRLVDGLGEEGSYKVRWDGTDESGAVVPSGIFICRLTRGHALESRKLVLMR
ncbi:MAG: FlgD immunoglobulin-like domain containing protein [Candidatus Oleimicrobiaceae bacterium]